ncbi:MAG: GntR family transcriptional regulator [Acetatifactor sp.]
MHLLINNHSLIPIYEQLVCQIKEQIFRGELKENEVLPSVRSLSAELKISALTVKKAYDALEADGFIQTIHGKGSFISPANREFVGEARKKEAEDAFATAIEKARLAKMSDDEIREIVELILTEG